MNGSNKLSHFLRKIGAVSIILSAIHFMMAGHYDLNSFSAFILFMGLNLIFFIFGIFGEKLFGGPETSKTFLRIALAIVPAQFAQLGGFIYSRYGQELVNGVDPFSYILPNHINLYLLVGVSCLLLTPFVFAGFKALDTKSINSLPISYLICSLSLLVPCRTSMNIYLVMTGALLICLLFLSIKQTSESTDANLLAITTFIPLIILIGRTFLYPRTVMFNGFILALITITLFFASKYFTDNDKIKNFSQSISAWTFLSSIYLFNLELNLDHSILYFLSFIGLHLMSYLANSGGKYFRVGSSILAFMFLWDTYQNQTIFIQVSCLLVPIILFTESVQKREKFFFIINSVSLVYFGIQHLNKILVFPEIGLWQALGLLGLVFVIMAGFLEKHIHQAHDKIKKFMREVK